MPRITLYTVQTFSQPRRKLEADQPLQFKVREEALRRAQRSSAVKVGVMVIEVTGDPEFDDFDEPVVIFRAGQLPQGMNADD